MILVIIIKVYVYLKTTYSMSSEGMSNALLKSINSFNLKTEKGQQFSFTQLETEGYKNYKVDLFHF